MCEKHLIKRFIRLQTVPLIQTDVAAADGNGQEYRRKYTLLRAGSKCVL